jgi:hypothetical protein
VWPSKPNIGKSGAIGIHPLVNKTIQILKAVAALPVKLGLSIPPAEAVIRVLEARFDWTFLGLLALVWFCASFLGARDLAERQLDREAKIVRIGGWVYLAVGAMGYLSVQAYYLIFF